jgi:hypothetical protein
MGTKNNPSKFDCYTAAELDEPMFVLLGRDPVARYAVLLWIHLRMAAGIEVAGAPKLQEAIEVSDEMKEWALKLDKKDTILAAEQAFYRLIPIENDPAIKITHSQLEQVSDLCARVREVASLAREDGTVLPYALASAIRDLELDEDAIWREWLYKKKIAVAEVGHGG